MSIEVGQNSSEVPKAMDSELVSGVTLPENRPEEIRRQAVARVLARPSLGVAGDFANELAARIG
jgi:hypothetical protein